MCTKFLKAGLILVVAACLVGALLFGQDMLSYIRSAARSVQKAVKSSVPIEFELKRARDMLDEIIPEMHANIRLIAQEEVEVAALKSEIEKGQESMTGERQRIAKLRDSLGLETAEYTFAARRFTKVQLKEDLARRFERFKEAELVLASKERLLVRREDSLQAAVALLEQTRAQKRLLEDKIGALDSQYRVVKASAIGSGIDIDNGKLAQTERLIGQIRKRLDVAERVLAHESRFVQSIPVDTVAEEDLLEQIDEYFGPGTGKGDLSVARESSAAESGRLQ